MLETYEPLLLLFSGFICIFCLGADTNPVSGQKFVPLARRIWNCFSTGLEFIFGKAGI